MIPSASEFVRSTRFGQGVSKFGHLFKVDEWVMEFAVVMLLMSLIVLVSMVEAFAM